MALREELAAAIEAFLEYIEDDASHDERYGDAHRVAYEDSSVLASRFQAGTDCWFEVAVVPDDSAIRVSFVTSDEAIYGDIAQGGEGENETVADLLNLGYAESGIAKPFPEVHPYPQDSGEYGFASTWVLEDIEDVEAEAVRNRSLGLLEAYMIAFGPMMMEFDDEEEETEEDD